MDNLILRTDMAATMSRLGDIIRNSGYTDRDISEIIGISVQAVNKWRHGHSFPDTENLYALCRILGIAVDDIFVTGENACAMDHNHYCETGNLLGMKMRIMAYYWMMRGAYICHKKMSVPIAWSMTKERDAHTKVFKWRDCHTVFDDKFE